MAAKGADEGSTASIVEGGNSVSSRAPEQPVCSTVTVEAWPGSSSGADIPTDDSSENNIRVEDAPEPVTTCPDSTQIPRDRASSVEAAQTSPNNLQHDVNTGSSLSRQRNNNRPGTAQQPMMPDRPASADVATELKLPGSGCDVSDCHDFLRTLPPGQSTTVRSVHTQSNAEHSQTDQVAHGGPPQRTSNAQPTKSKKKATAVIDKAEAMAGSWRTVGGSPPQRGPTDSTRKGG